MPLSAGMRLGPYEILSALGAGGMGEVCRARDTRLGRTVAIKILPEHLSSNPQLRERFDREAKAVSSLTHPHICPLYDVGHQDGIDYLVMEHLEGETLAGRLKKGPLPPDHEMAAGRKAFEGKSQASMISAIMSADPPPISTLQSIIPRALDHVVRTCLAKEPDARWQTAHDVLVELKWIAEPGSAAVATKPEIARRKSRELLVPELSRPDNGQ
jgi:serine/threonine protein kinase